MNVQIPQQLGDRRRAMPDNAIRSKNPSRCKMHRIVQRVVVTVRTSLCYDYCLRVSLRVLPGVFLSRELGVGGLQKMDQGVSYGALGFFGLIANLSEHLNRCLTLHLQSIGRHFRPVWRVGKLVCLHA
jgi:hypothetical protein